MENKVRLQIFNHVSRNGHIYIADTIEDVEKVFGKFKDEKTPLWLTNDFQGVGFFDRLRQSGNDLKIEFSTVRLQKIAGIFKDIEIVETGDIGYNDKPIFEVYGNLKIVETPPGKMAKQLLEEKVCTFGMRSFSTAKNGFGPKTYDIENIVCFDLINNGESNG